MGIGVWENQQIPQQIIIATPHTGLVNWEWAVSYKILQPPVPYNIISNKGLPIDRARCELVEQAKAMNATHIFFLDSDVIMPWDGLIRLYNHRLPIVSGVYGSKLGVPAVWVEANQAGANRYAAIAPQVLEQNQLFTHPKLVVGAGCLLIDMAVFNQIKKPYFQWTQGYDESGESEDFFFCRKAEAAGYPVYVDMTVKCYHVDGSKLNWKGERERLG